MIRKVLYNFYEIASGCLVCNPGFIEHGNSCVKFKDSKITFVARTHCDIANCKTCDLTDSHRCFECDDNYYLFDKNCFMVQSNGNTPICYIKNCEYCRGDNEWYCGKCVDNFYINNGACSLSLNNYNKATLDRQCKVINCEICRDDQTNVCRSCKPGHYLNFDDTECIHFSIKQPELSPYDKVKQFVDSNVAYVFLGVFLPIIAAVVGVSIYCYIKKKREKEENITTTKSNT